jgi:phospholipase C
MTFDVAREDFRAIRGEKVSDDPIKHVVLLALENHSFDQMLGGLKALYPELDGVAPDAPHANNDADGSLYIQTPTKERQMPFDPPHDVQDVAEQLGSGNGGFVKSFSKTHPDSKPDDRQFIMGYYPPDFLPGLHQLARHFTICDRWFSSVPGPTWPNRFMALTGTAKGRVSMPDDGTKKADLAGYFQQDQDTIFDRLNEKSICWKSYFHDIPQSWVLSHQRLPHNVARYFYIDQFYSDTRGHEEDFPEFCFIEPDFMGTVENDDHPPHDVMKAQKLIADVYNAIRANPELWRSTLLIIYYDEHGGFYDHVTPPKAVPPDDDHAEYSFDRFGVRVPALLVSPWVDRGIEKTQFDHTSVLKYLIEKWRLRPLPSKRIACANSIGVALRTQMREDGLPRIELTRDQLTPPNLEREEQAIADTSAHDVALKRLRDHLWRELDESTPGFFAKVADIISRMETCFRSSAPTKTDGRGFSVSIAKPDRLGSGDTSVKDDIARWMMYQKQTSVAVLADRIRNEGHSDDERRHSARTLEMMTGRHFRHVDKLDQAKKLLDMHGQ